MSEEITGQESNEQVTAPVVAPVKEFYQGDFKESDMPADPYAAQPEDNIYDIQFSSDDNQRQQAATNAAIVGMSRGDNFGEAYEEGATLSPDEAREKIHGLAWGDVEQGTVDAFDLLTEDANEFLTQDALQMQADYKDDLEKLNPTDNVLAHYRGYAMSLENGANMSPEQIDDIAFSKYTQDKIASIMDEDYSGGDLVMDMAGLMFVPNISYDTAELAKALGDTGYTANYVNSSEFLLKVRGVVGDKNLPIKQRMKFFDALSDELGDIESNKQKQVMLLMGLAGHDSEKQIELDLGMDKFDQITAGASAVIGIGSRVIKALRTFNTLHTITKANDVKTMAMVADTAMRTPDGAKAMGVSQLDAAAAADPRTDAIASLLDGAPAGIASKLRGEFAQIDELATEATNIVDEGLGLTALDKVKAGKKAAKPFFKNPDIENVKYATSKTGTTIHFEIPQPDGSVIKGKSKEQPFTVNDVGDGFIEEGAPIGGEAFTYLASPNLIQGRDTARIVQPFERIMFQSSKIKDSFNKAINVAASGLNKTEAKNVSATLQKGDAEAKVFSYQEAVLDGIGGNRMTEKEFESYAGMRRVMDNAWKVKNNETRKTLVAKGAKEITIDGTKYITVPMDSAGAAKAAYRESAKNMVSIPKPPKGNGTSVTHMTDEQIDDFYKKGYTLVRGDTMGEYYQIGDTQAAWAMVRKNEVNELPAQVLNRAEGYVTRTYKNNHFFLKQDRRESIDGKDVNVGRRTIRYFDNNADAVVHLGRMQDEALKAGEEFDEKMYHIMADGETTPMGVDTDGVEQFGGLYTGKRGDEILKFGLDGKEGERVDAIEAIQNYTQHIGNRYPMAEYKIGIQKAWMNDARNKGLLEHGFAGSFADARAVVEGATSKPAGRTKLLNAHDHISEMVKAPDKASQRVLGLQRAVGVKLEKAGWSKSAKKVLNAEAVDPATLIRKATFSTMLGMWNPAQIFVQSMGATIALSVHPVHAVKSFPRSLAFWLMDNISNASQRKTLGKFLSNKKELELGTDIAADHALWLKTGMKESVLAGNADVANVMQGLPYSAGMLQKAAGTHTVFYKMGELANMRVSFNTALSKWKANNPNKAVDDSALQQIISRTEQLRLQMSPANKASWQKGNMAVPTQFMQVNAKFMEALGGKNFTYKEKARMFALQGGLFGTAGMIGADTVFNQVMGDVSAQDMSAEALTLAKEGVLGWFAQDILDMNTSLTSRAAIGGQVFDKIQEVFFDQSEAPKILLGPSASTVERSWNVLMTTANAFKIGYQTEELTLKDAGQLAQVVGKSIASVPASSRNVLLAMSLANGGPFRTKTGKYIYQEDQNMQTIIMQGLGFGNKEYAQYWEAEMDNKKYMTAKKNAVTSIVNMYLPMLQDAEDKGEKTRAYQLGIESMLTSFSSEKDRNDIMGGVKTRLARPNDPQGKQIRKILENAGSEFMRAGSQLNSNVIEKLEEANNAK